MKGKNNKIVLYLINEKGFYVLSNFLKKFNPSRIEYIVLYKDKNIKKDYYQEMVDLCEKYSIKHFEKQNFIPMFDGYKIVIGWKWIIKDQTNLVVLHDSILPKYRGFAPLVNMLINGERKIGVTAFFASDQYDKGNIIRQETIKIDYPIKIYEAIQIILPLYSNLVNYIADLIFDNKKIINKPQENKCATYSLWRDDWDYFINWDNNSKTIRRMIDAVGYPYGGAKTYLNNRLIVIDQATEYPDVQIENRDTGKIIFVLDGKPVVVCGKGLLQIESASYINGGSILPLIKFRSRFGKQKNDII